MIFLRRKCECLLLAGLFLTVGVVVLQRTFWIGGTSGFEHEALHGDFSSDVKKSFAFVSPYAEPNTLPKSEPAVAHKLILLWDTFSDLHLWDGAVMFKQYKCPQDQCSMTYDRKFLWRSDAVVFHMRETLYYDSLPNDSRMQTQKWVFALKEPPVYSYFDLKSFSGVFNWTMTYKMDSDIPWPYGTFRMRPKPRTKLPDYYGEKVNAAKRMQNLCLSNTTSSADISWIVSRCHSQSKREDYVKELQKWIPVDVYGRCGTCKCNYGNSTDSCQNILKKYHFYLAFENSFCPDYVTEKLFKVLAMEELPVIPIVLGGGNYSQLAPPGSVVDVQDFDSPQLLASFLRDLLHDQRLYNSYHEWRRRYRIVSWGTPMAICRLCEKLHANTTAVKVRGNLFWSKELCHRREKV